MFIEKIKAVIKKLAFTSGAQASCLPVRSERSKERTHALITRKFIGDKRARAVLAKPRTVQAGCPRSQPKAFLFITGFILNTP